MPSEVCSASPALCSVDANKIGTSCGQQSKIKDDKVAIKLLSIRNTLDSVFFCDALITEAAVC